LVGILYNRLGGGEGVFGGVYIWPDVNKVEMDGVLEKIDRWDWASVDFNAQHEFWGNPHTNSVGRVVRRWLTEKGYEIAIPDGPTFWNISTINLTVLRKESKFKLT